MTKNDNAEPTRREVFITNISTSAKGTQAIEQLKELEDDRGPEGINQLKERILEACFLATYYQRKKDFYEIAREIDKEFLKINSLLELLKKHPHFYQIKALHFAELLSDNGIKLSGDNTIIDTDKALHFAKLLMENGKKVSGDDNIIDPDKALHFAELLMDNGIKVSGDDTITDRNLVPILEVTIESLRDSTCLHTGNSRSVIGNMDYGYDLINTNQKPDVGKMGLIYNLVIIIEYWKNSEFVRPGDKLMRQLDNGDKSRFLHYDIVTSFVNATFDENKTTESIQNKLDKHLANNVNMCYAAPLIFD